MSIRTFASPEVILGAALVIFLLLLIVSMVLNKRPDARMEFFWGLMDSPPKDDEIELLRTRGEPKETAEEEEPVLPHPRSIDF
jgi:hypothetical protein